MGDPNCYNNAFLDNCYVCPNGNSTSDCTINAIRRRRINNQSRMSSSMGLLKKRSLVVSKQVGQGACPQKLLTGGGPGDWAASIQKSNYPKAVGRAACYNMGRLRNRTAYKNNRGVDRKHGSYNRYLARRVGGVLRAEQMPAVINKTAFIGQPRIRSGTRCDCNQKETTKKCGDTYKTKDYACCNNRIPAGPTSILTVGLDVAGYNFYGYLNPGTGALNPPFKIGGQDVRWIGYQARDPAGLSGFDNRFYVTYNCDQEKIYGNYSKAQIDDAIDEYISLNYNKKIKPLLTMRDNKGKLKFVHETAHAKVKNLMEKMYLPSR